MPLRSRSKEVGGSETARKDKVMRKKLIWIVGSLIVLGWCGLASAQEIVRYSGSSTILKAIMYTGAKEFEKKEGVKFDLKGETTEFGLKKLLAGECDIAGGGSPLKTDEKSAGLIETKIFLDGYAFIVNATNPVSELAVNQIAEILNGTLNQWDSLGGPAGKKIIIISPPENSAHFQNGKKLIGFQSLPKNSMKVEMTPDVYSKVKEFPVSIGWLSSATVADKKDVKVLRILKDGQTIAMDQQTVTSGKYPYQQAMYFFTKGEPKGNVKKFIDFVRSDAGKKIITGAGFFLPE